MEKIVGTLYKFKLYSQRPFPPTPHSVFITELKVSVHDPPPPPDFNIEWGREEGEIMIVFCV